MTPKLLNTLLEDDNTPYGGVSYQGETLGDFLCEAYGDIPTDLTLKEINKELKACGIKPIRRA